MELQHCEYGNHDVEEQVLGCHHCHRAICLKHTGNPDTLPGDWLACLDHVEEVAAINAAQNADYVKHQKTKRKS